MSNALGSMPFDITVEQIKSMVSEVCPLQISAESSLHAAATYWINFQ